MPSMMSGNTITLNALDVGEDKEVQLTITEPVSGEKNVDNLSKPTLSFCLGNTRQNNFRHFEVPAENRCGPSNLWNEQTYADV